MTDKANTTDKADQHKPEFLIQKIYVKDISFEAPDTPAVFKQQWQPHINLDLNIHHEKFEEDVYEVVLKVTVTAKSDDKTLVLVEVHQAGIFTLKDFPEKTMHELMGSYCPSILFPYARESVSELVVRGGFPAIYLTPVNFEALYQQSLKKTEEQEKNNDKKVANK